LCKITAIDPSAAGGHLMKCLGFACRRIAEGQFPDFL
jgi:hypothetical protein